MRVWSRLDCWTRNGNPDRLRSSTGNLSALSSMFRLVTLSSPCTSCMLHDLNSAIHVSLDRRYDCRFIAPGLEPSCRRTHSGMPSNASKCGSSTFTLTNSSPSRAVIFHLTRSYLIGGRTMRFHSKRCKMDLVARKRATKRS